MNYEIKCPQCNGPVTNTVQVDRVAELDVDVSTFEMLHEQAKDGNKAYPILILKCQRCGWTKFRILQGLPDDEQTYRDWAKQEVQIEKDLPHVFGGTPK